jgi:hypothetical protein
MDRIPVSHGRPQHLIDKTNQLLDGGWISVADYKALLKAAKSDQGSPGELDPEEFSYLMDVQDQVAGFTASLFEGDNKVAIKVIGLLRDAM